ncbi:MAG: efflux RND transporter permease subunit, partial [Xanthobacteraceae bacterium]
MIARLIRWSANNLVLVMITALFCVLAGLYAMTRIPLDAIPDLSDTQVIVYTEYQGQAPQVIEDQVTYPLASAMLSVPRSRVVRGFSFFGVSFVYVIFEDGTDIYWARSRVLEYLNAAAGRVPSGVTPTLGPDASGVGWVYQYALNSKNHDLSELRSLQDWHLRFGLAKAEGVAEVAAVGGFVRQYAIVIDPQRMKTFGITLDAVRNAVRASNMDVGGRTIELSETEFMIRGRGYLRTPADLERVVLKAQGGTPVTLKDIARIELAPDERRGIAELNGEGEVASGIALQRYGGNALDVITSVKERLSALRSSLPEGVEITEVYDRSDLIHRAIRTLIVTLTEESVIVALVCFLFLLHARSALVAIITLPIGILMAMVVMHVLGIDSNIMSLGGIAIAIGAMVDASIVMVENAHKRLEHAPPGSDRREVLIAAAQEVGPALFFSLLVITVSFLPIFALEAQEGRMFKPLAYTKTFAMAAAAILSVTLVPALMLLFIRGRIMPESRNPINRALIWLYRPVIRTVLKARLLTVLLAGVILGVSIIPATRIGSEFMPNLNEGTLFYMPTTLPGLSVTKAAELLQTQNRIIKSFPEVKSVWGKAGRANTATDPAPIEMFETIINLKPQGEWRAGLTVDKLIAEMDASLQFPGVSNAWTMPIKARIDMLSTGIRTPVGVKIFGKDLVTLESLAKEVETALRKVPGTSSAYAERVNSGYFLEITPDRDAIARLGLSIEDVQKTISLAIGAEVIATTVEGRERYGVVLRYPRDIRSDPEAIASEVL